MVFLEEKKVKNDFLCIKYPCHDFLVTLQSLDSRPPDDTLFFFEIKLKSGWCVIHPVTLKKIRHASPHARPALFSFFFLKKKLSKILNFNTFN